MATTADRKMDLVSWIPADDWETVVRNVPIASVDLVVQQEGGVLLGRRENEPAKGEWFIPGGRVLKGERLTDAVHRVADEELGIEVEITDTLGAYDHFYERSDVGADVAKHYVAHGFVVQPLASDFSPDTQHAELRVFQSPPDDLHEYPRQYLQAMSGLDWW